MAFDISVNASKTINALVYFSTQQDKLVIRNEVNDIHYTVEFDRDKVVDTFISYNRHNDSIEIRGVLPEETNIGRVVNTPVSMTYLYNKYSFKPILAEYIRHRNTISGNIYSALMTLDDLVIKQYGDIDLLFNEKLKVDSDSGLFDFVNFVKDMICCDSRIVVALSSLVSKHWELTNKKYRCMALAEHIANSIPISELSRLRYNLCKYLRGHTDSIEDEFDYFEDDDLSTCSAVTDRETDV
ncbi:Bcl-2-like protein [Monkeypox virus]|nr:Bcl-2-like protein [Monkeypox virus]UVY81757.1 Bcl-2-like protein [Monkeypox virus]UWW06805.1 Bcl-2-like protein [Monkeypox virus]UXW75525.1 Bcl-2-like protein [Monkeypox virus]UXW76050.1 Bcl-2-like protein [Monkeypox virus]